MLFEGVCEEAMGGSDVFQVGFADEPGVRVEVPHRLQAAGLVAAQGVQGASEEAAMGVAQLQIPLQALLCHIDVGEGQKALRLRGGVRRRTRYVRLW